MADDEILEGSDAISAEVPTEPTDAETTVAEAPGTPVVGPSPVEAPVSTPQSPIDQQHLSNLEQQNADLLYQKAESEQRDALTNLEQQVAQYQLELEQEGLTTEQAWSVAQRAKGQFQQVQQAHQRTDSERLYRDAQTRAVRHFSKQYGVDQEILFKYPDQDSMEDAAKRESRFAKQAREIAELKRSVGPPAQTFDSNRTTPAMVISSERDLDRYNAGDRSPGALAAARKAAGLE
jgi:hypothetical protein